MWFSQNIFNLFQHKLNLPKMLSDFIAQTATFGCTNIWAHTVTLCRGYGKMVSL